MSDCLTPDIDLYCIIQIFEWCSYMRLSGRLPARDPKRDQISVVLKEGHILPEQLTELEGVYRHVLPQFSRLLTEYEKEQQRLKRSQKKIVARNQWSPLARQLTEKERDLLLGPKSNVKFLRKASLREAKTGRLLDYTSSDCVTASRVSCSYVARGNDKHSPTFARIKTLFEHQFSDTSYTWACIQCYSVPSKDPDSGLWNVPSGCVSTYTVLLSELSRPLVVAVETSPARVWFLNF